MAASTPFSATIEALRYAAVECIEGPDGSGIYTFVFHLRAKGGATYRLAARYSVFRAMYKALLAEQPEACASLPAFPRKNPLSRQTSAFLLARGKGLESYLGAVLGDVRLSNIVCVKELLKKVTLLDAGAPKELAVSVASAETRQSLGSWQAQKLLQNGTAPRQSFVSSALAVATQPTVPLLISCLLGYLYSQLLMCVGCCVFGIATGRICLSLLDSRRPVEPPNGTEASKGSSNSQGGNGAAHAEKASTPPRTPNEPSEPPSPLSPLSMPATPTGVQPTPLQQVVMREAVEALRLMDEALERKSSDGWALFHVGSSTHHPTSPQPTSPHMRTKTHPSIRPTSTITHCTTIRGHRGHHAVSPEPERESGAPTPLLTVTLTLTHAVPRIRRQSTAT